MNITLNIGLQVSNNYLPGGVEPMKFHGVQQIQWQYEYIKEYLEKVLGTPSCIGLAQSVTEETIVAQYTNVEDVLKELYQIAQDLQQDCIAYQIKDYDVIIGGALVGEYAHEWNFGIFDEAYFLQASMKLKYREGLPF